MPAVIDASTLTLQDVRDRLHLDRQIERDFSPFLELQPLSDSQNTRLQEILQIWDRYNASGKVSEGAVKMLVVSPLVLELSGYLSDRSVRISLEENIAEIVTEDDGTTIRGRMDILICRTSDDSATQTLRDRASLCVLVIETKNSAIATSAALPQLLAYASSFLDRQACVWGLATNGTDYQFVRLERGLYRQFRSLSATFPEEATRLVEVAIAIRSR